MGLHTFIEILEIGVFFFIFCIILISELVKNSWYWSSLWTEYWYMNFSHWIQMYWYWSPSKLTTENSHLILFKTYWSFSYTPLTMLARQHCHLSTFTFFCTRSQGVVALVSESETNPNNNLMIRRAGLFKIWSLGKIWKKVVDFQVSCYRKYSLSYFHIWYFHITWVRKYNRRDMSLSQNNKPTQKVLYNVLFEKHFK